MPNFEGASAQGSFGVEIDKDQTDIQVICPDKSIGSPHQTCLREMLSGVLMASLLTRGTPTPAELEQLLLRNLGGADGADPPPST